jgi:phenylacetic acid degradation operon negative regulatory protein
MQARSALFDLYGDYLRPRGGRAPVAALVKLLAPLGIAAPAVRTAVSRMVRQGWLLPLRLESGPGYLLTPKAARRLDEAAARIYRTGKVGWDGRFDLVIIGGSGRDAKAGGGMTARDAKAGGGMTARDAKAGGGTALSRRDRQRLADNLAFLGYGSLDDRTWVATRAAQDVDLVLVEAGVAYERFTASHAAGTTGAVALVRRAWDLTAIGQAYDRFVAELSPVVSSITSRSGDEEAYAARFRLVHAWRAFLFRDPQLPPALLPEGWPGTSAAAFFDRHAARLRPAADRYVERCLDHFSLQKGVPS